jgi:hypothetical protein
MGYYQLEIGETKIDLLICNRAAMLFIDGLRGITQESLQNTEKNGVLLLDKTVSAIYFCHKSFCEDDDIPVQIKRSVIFELITSTKGAVNIKQFMDLFSDALQSGIDKVTKETKKKEQLKATL